jgi:alkylated DNA nucleotide flippase Atl1
MCLPTAATLSHFASKEDVNMASSRAEDLAEVLWELKRAGKVATFTTIARRAGFSAGANGRAVQTALRAIRRDWPHLQWWRAVKDDGQVEKGSEHEDRLVESGYSIMPVAGKEDVVTLASFTEIVMKWEEEAKAEKANA